MQPQLLHIMCTVRWLSSSVASPLFFFSSSSCSFSSKLETWSTWWITRSSWRGRDCMDLEIPFWPNVAKDWLVWNLDDSYICVVTIHRAKRIKRPEGGSFAEFAFVIKFGFFRATMDGIGLGFGNVLDEMWVEVVKINLGILNLFKGLVDGVSISVSSSVSVKVVHGVWYGPVCGGVTLWRLGVEQLSAMASGDGKLIWGMWSPEGCAGLGLSGVIVVNRPSRFSSSSLVLAESSASVLDISHFLSLKSSKSSQDMEHSDSGGSSLSSLLHHSNSERMFMNLGNNSLLDWTGETDIFMFASQNKTWIWASNTSTSDNNIFFLLLRCDL